MNERTKLLVESLKALSTLGVTPGTYAAEYLVEAANLIEELSRYVEWQDASTPPENGKLVATYGVNSGYNVCYYNEDDRGQWDHDVTHYLLLPEVPEVE